VYRFRVLNTREKTGRYNRYKTSQKKKAKPKPTVNVEPFERRSRGSQF